MLEKCASVLTVCTTIYMLPCTAVQNYSKSVEEEPFGFFFFSRNLLASSANSIMSPSRNPFHIHGSTAFYFKLDSYNCVVTQLVRGLESGLPGGLLLHGAAVGTSNGKQCVCSSPLGHPSVSPQLELGRLNPASTVTTTQCDT